MRSPIALIIAMVIETFLLILTFLVLIVGVLGFFLPILPGIFFIGIAVAIYSLLVNSKRGVITPQVHKVVSRVKNRVLNYKIIKSYMGIIKRLKNNKQVKEREEILKYGLILFSINAALSLALVFGFIGLSFLFLLLSINGLALALVPLALVFIFAATSAIVWFRFGQILQSVFKKRQASSTFLVILVSFLPMFAFLISITGLLSLTSAWHNTFLVLLFLGFLLMSILTAIFELMIINFGLMTSKK